jgi:hypothetical protein
MGLKVIPLEFTITVAVIGASFAFLGILCGCFYFLQTITMVYKNRRAEGRKHVEKIGDCLLKWNTSSNNEEKRLIELKILYHHEEYVKTTAAKSPWERLKRSLFSVIPSFTISVPVRNRAKADHTKGAETREKDYMDVLGVQYDEIGDDCLFIEFLIFHMLAPSFKTFGDPARTVLSEWMDTTYNELNNYTVDRESISSSAEGKEKNLPENDTPMVNKYYKNSWNTCKIV